jgi:DNA invertase Pin-like site-specific DNA recombinase
MPLSTLGKTETRSNRGAGEAAEYEREKIRERTMRGNREKARQGKVVSTGAVPFGFRYNKEKATL